MDGPASDNMALWPFVVYFAAVLLVTAGTLLVSWVLGQRHSERATGEPYESGIVSTGSARVRFDVRYYVVALLFVIFDLEAVFLIAWAIAVREVGWAGFAGAMVFIAILTAALIYEWRVGALDWGPRGRRLPQQQQQQQPSQEKETALS